LSSWCIVLYVFQYLKAEYKMKKFVIFSTRFINQKFQKSYRSPWNEMAKNKTKKQMKSK